MKFQKGFLLSALSLIFSGHLAQAGLSSINLGYSSQQAMGNNYLTLGRADGFQASATYDYPSLGQDLRFRGTVNYHGHKVKNLTDGRISLFGFYAGLEVGAPVPREQFRLQPNMGIEIGGVVDSLSPPGGSSTSNAAFLFSTRIVPGMRSSIPGISNLIWGIELPIAWTFSRNSLTTWSAVFNLGWAL